MLRLTSTDGRNFADLYYGQDVREALKSLPDKSVHMIATSPPYYGLRNYGVDGQIGLEESPEEYVKTLVEVLREARRVLRDDGTLWLNLGDSYATNGVYINAWAGKEENQDKDNLHSNHPERYKDRKAVRGGDWGIKAKDLMGIPWRVAFALHADGWYLRSDIIWRKPAPLPESVIDRPTKSHEYIFLLTKQPRYFYDLEAIRETPKGDRKFGANRRSVWDVAAKPYKGAHFAVWPEELVSLMIRAGSSEKGCCPTCGASWIRVIEKGTSTYEQVKQKHGSSWKTMQESADARGTNLKGGVKANGGTRLSNGTQPSLKPAEILGMTWKPGCTCPEHEPIPCTVMDIFSGSATTGKVAWGLGRNYIGIDLNPDYLPLAQERLLDTPAQAFREPGTNPLGELW